MKYLISLLFMAVFSTPLLAEYPVEILPLNGHSPEEVIPVIERFIDKEGSVAAANDQLIVRTSPDNLSQIKKILDSIDKPSRRLMIYVRQTSGNPPATGPGGAGGAVGTGKIIGLPGDPGIVKPGQIIGLPPAAAPTGRRGIQAGTRSDRDQTQQVQVVEGKPAYIETGTQVPIYDGAVGVGPLGYGAAVNTRYKNVATGFYALARTNGNQVTVAISTEQIQQGSSDERFDTRRARTTLSGQLGEWLPLGGTSRSTPGTRQPGGINASTSSNREHAIYLMVEEMN